VFHYALNSNGFLFLGSSESVGDYTNLFTLVDQKAKIYTKNPVSARPPIEFGFRQYPVEPVPAAPRPPITPTGAVGGAVQKEADRIAIERFVPPGVLVDGNLQILQFRGDTSPFLRHAPGRASLDLVEMARQGLDTALKGYLPKVKGQRGTVRIEGVQVRQNGDFRGVDVEIVPVPSQGDEDHYLIFFREPALPVTPARGKAKSAKVDTQGVEMEQLRRDLVQTRDQLRMTVEEKDASVEELRAANEEIQSSNEELQSINEELETAKEELQSTNEELTTLNEELQNRNYELQSINDDLRNVLSSVNVPIIILGKDLRIRRYTPMAERVLNLIPSDVGRPITDLKLKIDVPDLPTLVSGVLSDLSAVERDVADASGRTYRLELRPYRTAEDRIEGVVIALLDVSDAKSGAEEPGQSAKA
jgi:two-component system CheB/CheR fusion protein